MRLNVSRRSAVSYLTGECLVLRLTAGSGAFRVRVSVATLI
jgi:hypothetical protein